MQETSGSRSYLPLGSARACFADLPPFPIAYFSSSRKSLPTPGAASGCLRSSGIRFPKILPMPLRASGHHKITAQMMTYDSSCLCHQGLQNELMDG